MAVCAFQVCDIQALCVDLIKENEELARSGEAKRKQAKAEAAALEEEKAQQAQEALW
jgi:hypothetical protein